MVYRAMVDSLRTQRLTKYDIISELYFYLLWSVNFRSTVIPKNNLFSKCDTCVRYSHEREKLAGNKESIRELEQEYADHKKEWKLRGGSIMITGTSREMNHRST
jgi:hypothetical protein